MKADAFFLLENQLDRAHAHHLEKFGIDLHTELNRTGVPWEAVKVNLWSPAAVGGCLRDLVHKHGLRELLVNASVGPNTVAVGGSLASLFAPIRLFHPGGTKPDEPLQSLEDVRWLPTLRLPDWSSRHIAVLDALEAFAGRATGGQVKEWLRANRPTAIGKGPGKGNWSQKEHARFQALTVRLRDAGAIEYTISHRRWDLQILDTGKELRILLADLES